MGSLYFTKNTFISCFRISGLVVGKLPEEQRASHRPCEKTLPRLLGHFWGRTWKLTSMKVVAPMAARSWAQDLPTKALTGPCVSNHIPGREEGI